MRRTHLHFLVLAFGSVIVAGGFAACSLGKGHVPTCNAAQTDPKAADACHKVAKCDLGGGLVDPSVQCCDEAASQQYATCSGNNDDAGPNVFITKCCDGNSDNCDMEADPSPNPEITLVDNSRVRCCGNTNHVTDTAYGAYLLCREGVLSGVGGGGGMGGAGGMGGSGGGGMGGSGGGGMGGGGTGGTGG